MKRSRTALCYIDRVDIYLSTLSNAPQILQIKMAKIKSVVAEFRGVVDAEIIDDASNVNHYQINGVGEQTICNAERYSYAFSEHYKHIQSAAAIDTLEQAGTTTLIAPSSTLDMLKIREIEELYADVEGKLEAVRTLTSNLQQLFENVNIDGITLLPKDYHQFTKEQEVVLFNYVEDMSKFVVLINSKVKKSE